MFWRGTPPAAPYFADWGYEYIIVGLETCPNTGREHYQGYVRFKNARSLDGVRKLLVHTYISDEGKAGYPGHWEPCKGTEAQNVAYCSKDNNVVFEDGSKEAGQGKRSDIALVKDLVSKKSNMRTIIDNTNSYQAMRCAEFIMKYKEPARTEKPFVTWIWGPTGTGKSHYVLQHAKDLWVSMGSAQWFEGYDGHEDILLDDFRSSWCSFVFLLQTLQNVPQRLPIKGSSRQNLAKRIWITSCYSPETVYNSYQLGGEDVVQLTRRLDSVIHLTQRYFPSQPMGPSLQSDSVTQKSDTEVGGNTPPTLPGQAEQEAAPTSLNDILSELGL